MQRAHASMRRRPAALQRVARCARRSALLASSGSLPKSQTDVQGLTVADSGLSSRSVSRGSWAGAGCQSWSGEGDVPASTATVRVRRERENFMVF
jgi:hypothetical protein